MNEHLKKGSGIFLSNFVRAQECTIVFYATPISSPLTAPTPMPNHPLSEVFPKAVRGIFQGVSLKIIFLVGRTKVVVTGENVRWKIPGS